MAFTIYDYVGAVYVRHYGALSGASTRICEAKSGVGLVFKGGIWVHHRDAEWQMGCEVGACSGSYRPGRGADSSMGLVH